MLRDERRVEYAAPELINRQSPSEELDVGWQADHMVVLQGSVEGLDRLLPRWFMDNELGDHGVVVGRDLGSLSHARVYAHLSWDLKWLS